MGRRRAERPVAAIVDAPAGRERPAGAARVAWSQVAGLLVAVIVGFVFAITDVVQQANCNSDDVACTLGHYVLGMLVGALLGVGVAAALFRLGWEWAAVAMAVVIAMPVVLDRVGPWGWLLAALTPTLAALATLDGEQRPPWRPVVVGGVSVLVAVAALLWTFFPPGA